jgi:hypothetical protein
VLLAAVLASCVLGVGGIPHLGEFGAQPVAIRNFGVVLASQ